MFDEDKEKLKEFETECYKRCDAIKTPADLKTYVEWLVEQPHTYSSIGIACTGAALAAIRTVDHSDCGGITGFQAGWIAWEFTMRFLHIDGPMRRVEFRHMLYPQYEADFDKTISPAVWKDLQEQARAHLAEVEAGGFGAEEVVAHWKSIVGGTVPFGYRVKKDDT
jgi:hypothetical protein